MKEEEGMSLSLFTDALDNVTADDVIAFLNLDIEEGTRLDYKEADPKQGQGIPQKTLDVIVAFANTAGGLLILGVKADKVTNRPVEREGLPLLKGLEERITSQCYSSIQPTYIPEVRVCPFKSDSQLSDPDRAFVVVRVQSSPSIHSTKENRVLVRMNSECRDADLTTLRFLFERERRREELLQEVEQVLFRGRELTVAAFKSPDGIQEPFNSSPYRTYIELLPLDMPKTPLPFGVYINGVGSLDNLIMNRIRMKRWNIQEYLHLPRGLGMLVYLGSLAINPVPIAVLYIDKSGGVLLDMGAKSFGYAHKSTPQQDVYANKSHIAQRYCMHLAELTDILWAIFREQGYTGRFSATIWSAVGEFVTEGSSPQSSKQDAHRGEVIFSITDQWSEHSHKIATMVNEMTRSWLGYSFGLKSWEKDGEPEFKGISG